MAAVVSESVNDFSSSFHRTLALADPNANIFFSPWSIATAFAIVLAGARGKTRRELVDVFKWTSSTNPNFHQTYGVFQEVIESQSNPDTYVKLANKVWVNQGFNVNKDFMATARERYRSEIGTADFQGQSEEARQRINSWVADHTDEKIRDLFPPGSLQSSTKLALANAIYFKGSWKMPFDKETTTSDDFFLSNTKAIKVDMMYSNEKIKVLSDKKAKCTVVELPYTEDTFAMVIVIPNEITGVSDLEKELNSKKLKEWSSRTRLMSADFFLPKFKIEHSIELKDVLSKMGLTDIFKESADLSGITEEEKLYVSSAYHKAYVQVDEEGTEAAAATGLGIMALSLPPQIRADRPFLFFIKDTKSGVLLFSGKVMNPAA